MFEISSKNNKEVTYPGVWHGSSLPRYSGPCTTFPVTHGDTYSKNRDEENTESFQKLIFTCFQTLSSLI